MALKIKPAPNQHRKDYNLDAVLLMLDGNVVLEWESGILKGDVERNIVFNLQVVVDLQKNVIIFS